MAIFTKQLSDKIGHDLMLWPLLLRVFNTSKTVKYESQYFTHNFLPYVFIRGDVKQ